MATKAPDENDRARGIGPPLPADPFDDAVPMLDPRTGAAPKVEADDDAKVEAEGKAEAERALRRAVLEGQRVGAFLDSAIQRMEARASGAELPVPVPWPSMAAALGGGLWPGCYAVVGNTGSGKSQFAIQIAAEAAAKGTPVLYIGLELGEVDLVARLLGLAANVYWSQLYLGEPVTVEGLRTRHAAKVEAVRALPFHLDFGGPFGWSYAELETKVRDLRALYPEPAGKGSRPMLVVLDFLQLVGSPDGVREELRERIAKAVYTARAVARAMDVAVLLVSSTSRENYAKLHGEKDKDGKAQKLGDGYPGRMVGLGKESGEIEYACDAALVLASEPRTKENPRPPVWLAVAKGRAVVPSWVQLSFDGSSFTEPKAPQKVNLRS